MQNEWEQVGTIGVDAGLCWIGDPCYILHADPKPNDIGKDWHEFCDKLWTDGQDGAPRSFNFDMGHEGLGVVVPTGYGDGSYPVFIKRNHEGRVIAVKVEFD